MIGEGNIVDNKSFVTGFERAGIPVCAFYPSGPMVRMGRWFHVRMSMNTNRTMRYAFKSDTQRSSFVMMPLKLELRRALKIAFRECPAARCFITSQNIMAEEASSVMGGIPAFMFSSDVYGKFHYGSSPSERQKNIKHFVWNSDALDYYRNVLNLKNVYLAKPADPIDAFPRIERDRLPFQEALTDGNICFIKLSGSGGDPELVNRAIISLWKNSATKCIVFPGTDVTREKLVKVVGSIKVSTSLDPSIFYNHSRHMISNEQMLLVYPSEQVKHVVLLATNGVVPRVVWLPPRGQHEVMNLAWAVKKGMSGSICIPEEFQGRLRESLKYHGVHSADLEFVQPQNLSAEHFKASSVELCEDNAVPLEDLVRKLSNI